MALRNRVTYFFIMENIKQAAEASSEAEPKFSDLGISESILGILTKLNLNVPTPIQHQAIPVALTGKDLIGIAQTGTGKTFAFGIPMLQKLALEKGQGLVVVPTRELALQVTESLKKLGTSLGLRLATLIGGEAVDRQLFALRKKPHIIVATPGRLLDFLKRRVVKLDQIKVLVLDEADMMFDLGFAKQVEEIIKQTPATRQTMLFSATMPKEIARLAANHLKLPISIEVSPQGTTVEKVEQEIYIVRPIERFDYLEKIIKEHPGSILVFVRTKHGVKEITKKLVSLGHSATEIHSNLSLNRRRAALDSFKNQKNRILVATDVAARGLDVNGIELVVNYNLPDASADYVHRVGRTGRAGKTGKAISLATPDQLRDIRDIERLINKSLPIREYARSDHPRANNPIARRHLTKKPRSSEQRYPAIKRPTGHRSASQQAKRSHKQVQAYTRKTSGDSTQIIWGGASNQERRG